MATFEVELGSSEELSRLRDRAELFEAPGSEDELNVLSVIMADVKFGRIVKVEDSTSLSVSIEDA